MESRTIKILAIDDNRDNLISIKALIKDIMPNALTLTTESGTKGLELAATEDPDVILLDIVMPVMDGYQVCKKLKADKKLSDIPVVFVTALKDDRESRILALEAGADAFLAKPIDESELKAQISAMVKIKTANSEKHAEKEQLAALVADQTIEIKLAYKATLNVLEDLKKENEARKKSEEDLLESNQFNMSLLQTIPFGIDIVDKKGNVLYLSDNLKQYLCEINPPKRCWEYYRDDKKQCSNCPLFAEIIIGEIESIESFGVLGGKTFEIVHTGMIFKGQTAMMEIFIDITERKRAERELILAKEKAEENERLKSAFLANMSHEIRTPMNGILGFAGLLKEPKLSGEEQQEYIGIIEKSGVRMLNIINDVIAISKVEAGQMKTFVSTTNINEQLEYIYNFFKPEVEQKGMHIVRKNSLTDSEVIIKTDKEKLYAILTNLVKNAIKFSDSGTIEIGYIRREKARLVSSTTEPKSASLVSAPTELEFFVKDSGVGIPKDRLEAIFDRFVQADVSDKRAFQGAGLGLSISKAYVEMLGGKIWVESDEGKGSAFYFTLPCNNEPEVVNPFIGEIPFDNVENKPNPKIPGFKILIAEDDEISGILISMAIKTFGRNVLKTSTGTETVEVCRNNPDLDFVLMDIKMPEMDGYEATRQIRQFNNEVIIIAQTAYALTGDREKALEAGCNDYIAKPFGQSSLTALMKKHLRQEKVEGDLAK
jgi:signal transduction histidine kinase/DNA-binding response OmpR family regulator